MALIALITLITQRIYRDCLYLPLVMNCAVYSGGGIYMKKKRFLIAAAVVFTLLVVLPAAGFCVLNWGVLPPEKLTPLAVREADKRIDGRFECERIELTFFETYPHLGVRATNGRIISRSKADTLLAFERAVVSLRPLDYLFDRKVVISKVFIKKPCFNGVVDADGVANWDIWGGQPQGLPLRMDSTEVAGSLSLPPFEIQKIRVKDGRVRYTDLPSGLYAEAEGVSCLLSGSSRDDGGLAFDAEAGAASLLFESPGYSLNKPLALSLNSRVELTSDFHTVTVRNTALTVNNLPFAAEGSFTLFPETNSLWIDLTASLAASGINDLLHFVPDAYFKNKEDIRAEGSVLLEGTVKGELGDSILPSVDVCCRIENGSLFMRGMKQGIDSLAMDVDLHIDGMNPDSSYLALEELTMEGLNTSLDIHGKVTGLLQSPAVEGCIQGNIDFTRLSEEFLHPDTLTLQGGMNGDIDVAFVLDDLLKGRYDKVTASGYLDIDTLKAFSRPFDMDILIQNAHFNIDSTRATSSYIEGSNLLGMSLNIDSLRLQYKDEINTRITRLAMTAKTSPVTDTAAVVSVTSRIRAEHLRTRLPDSTLIIAKQFELRGGVRPSASDKRTPNIAAIITADSLRCFSLPLQTGTVLDGSTFTVEALPYREALRQRRSADARPADARPVAADSTKARRTDRNRQAPDTTNSLLRNWEVRGKILFNQARIFSRRFPLPMRMERTEVKFDTNNITFADALFHAGNSNFTLTGDIINIRRALLRGGTLKGAFSVSSDYIDCNQLLQAAGQGMQFAEQQALSSAKKETLADMDTQILQDSATAVTDTIPPLFIVPQFLDLSLNMDAKQVDYKDQRLEDVLGEITLRNQSINLKKLEMNSSIGHGNLTLFYTAKDHSGASAGFDLEMNGILVEKVISLYPAIDSMLPMLRSFAGVLDCRATATCEIDSTMSVILPSLNTISFLHGQNMVLLDGETFAEISKTLMFKNKQQNTIANLSVDLAVKDSKIEVFPFLLEMDRYRVAVAGTHNLDMTFDYHISVLKSPVPFKLGIDVTGNMDKPKYKITKCRFKNTFDPAKEQDLIAAKTNIRERLRELINKQIAEI
ncbi:putative protein involved in outer membrane biogenesis [Bacteroidales bacterium Barb4]|nr:putative protein involved in outer membrane biogenesis [Bacteroidales bacterium Barb4]